jgi:hypothetical protein
MSFNRRAFCAAAVGTAIQGTTLAQIAAGNAARPVLTTPKIVGPIPVSADNLPYATALAPGSYSARLMKEFNYVEEEYFLFGYANIYGPGQNPPTAVSSRNDAGQSLKPLSAVAQPEMPYATRLLLVRPRDNSKFSGRVHAYTFHNVGTHLSVERNLLRNGDVVLGFEGCSGTRFGPLETPSGGIAQLHRVNLPRYRDLRLADASPLAWPDLKPGNLAKAAATLDFGTVNASSTVFIQELYRSYSQAPDIITQVAHALKNNHPAFPLEGKVKLLFNYGASGGSTIVQTYIDYHHNSGMMSDGRPPFDGYLIMVGLLPETRPRGAVLVQLDSESEVIKGFLMGRGQPPDTDSPPFRLYQIPGSGHSFSAPLPESVVAQADTGVRDIARTVPEGIAGLSDTGELPEGILRYDKINTPIVWGVWHNMYEWIENGVAMPKAQRVQLDPAATDGIARDVHGNALGGLRTPWVDVPDATYLNQISRKDPLRAGMRPFSEQKFKALYGSRAHYVKLVNRRVDQLVRDRWIQAEDATLMKLKS